MFLLHLSSFSVNLRCLSVLHKISNGPASYMYVVDLVATYLVGSLRSYVGIPTCTKSVSQKIERRVGTKKCNFPRNRLYMYMWLDTKL